MRGRKPTLLTDLVSRGPWIDNGMRCQAAVELIWEADHGKGWARMRKLCSVSAFWRMKLSFAFVYSLCSFPGIRNDFFWRCCLSLAVLQGRG